MATETLTMNSLVACTMGTIVSGNPVPGNGSALSSVTTPDDDITTYVKTTTTDSIEVGFSNTVAIGASDTITSVAITVRAQLSTGSAGTINGQVSDNTNYSAAQGSGALSTSWATFTLTFLTDPLGAAWTKAKLDALQLKLAFTGLSGNIGRITTIGNAVVTYTSAFPNKAAMMASLFC